MSGEQQFVCGHRWQHEGDEEETKDKCAQRQRDKPDNPSRIEPEQRDRKDQQDAKQEEGGKSRGMVRQRGIVRSDHKAEKSARKAMNVGQLKVLQRPIITVADEL